MNEERGNVGTSRGGAPRTKAFARTNRTLFSRSSSVSEKASAASVAIRRAFGDELPSAPHQETPPEGAPRIRFVRFDSSAEDGK